MNLFIMTVAVYIFNSVVVYPLTKAAQQFLWKLSSLSESPALWSSCILGTQSSRKKPLSIISYVPEKNDGAMKLFISYLIDPTDLGRGGNEGRSVTLCERALLARCWKYSSFENCGLTPLLSSVFGATGLASAGFAAFDKVSMKL